MPQPIAGQTPPDPPGFIVGCRYRTPLGPGVFLGLAAYEVQRLGAYAGRREYIWTDPATRVSARLDGPLAFGFPALRRVVGFTRDQFPATPEELPQP